jgi:NAD(P)H-dependent flavin oxidoreductase YrpB (nitropropane dioxygenase family)
LKSHLAEELGIDFPIFAFSHCRDVVAAVSNSGGLGVLGALAFTPEQLEIELDWIDEHVNGKPYGVDVVMPASYAGAGELPADASNAQMTDILDELIPEAHRRYVEDVLDRYGVAKLPEDDADVHRLLGWTHEGARPLVDSALSHPIRLLANALGPPPPDVVELAHAQGVKVAALVGTVPQAERQVQNGVDIIVASGYEAGGHTGEITTMVLVPDVVDAVAPVPVLAAGGIGDGRQVAAALALGAEGVWLGSIWLTTAESDMQPYLVEKLLASGSRDTARSRAPTGKPARQLRTAWTEAWEAPESPGTLPMPLQYMLTAEAQRRIGRSDVKELQGIPVGQIVSRMNQVKPVRQVMFELMEGFAMAAERLGAVLEDG